GGDRDRKRALVARVAAAHPRASAFFGRGGRPKRSKPSGQCFAESARGVECGCRPCGESLSKSDGCGIFEFNETRRVLDVVASNNLSNEFLSAVRSTIIDLGTTTIGQAAESG